MSCVPPTTFSWSVWRAVSPWRLTSMSMPRSSKGPLDVGEPVVGVVDDRRDVAAELRGLVGHRVGEREADRRGDGEQADVDGRHREAAGEAQPPLQARDERVEDQRQHRGHDEQQQHGAGRAGQRPEGQHRQREHDELDPARDDDGLHGPSGGVGGKLVAGHPREYVRRARRSRHPVRGRRGRGLGRRTLLALLPGLREELAPTFVVVNAENAAGGLGITPKIADELFAAGVDVITLATTRTTGGRSATTSTARTASCARRTSWRASRGTASAWSSATGSGSAS